MRLTALQLPARHGAPAAQLALVESLLASGAPTDLVLLPEAALTGYVSPSGDFDLSPQAEPFDGPTRAALARLAARFDCLMVGPIIEWEWEWEWERERERERDRERAGERSADRCCNALLAVTPGGEVLLRYRKRHPWYPETWATAGATSGPVARWRGVSLTAAICFDINFLAADAPEALGEADLLLFPSAWVDDADTLPARLGDLAVAHGIAVLGANWGSGEPRIAGQGGSMFVDARGTVTARLGLAAGRLDVTFDRDPARASRPRQVAR